MNIVIIGNMEYERNQMVVRYVLEHTNHKIALNDFFPRTTKRGTFHQIINLFRRIKFNLNCLNPILACDLVYFGVEATGSKWVSMARFFNKKIVTDYYISSYDTSVNDRKSYSSNSKKAKKNMHSDRRALLKSDYILFLNHSEAEYYTKLAGVDLSKLKYLIIPLFKQKFKKARLPYFHKENSTIILCWWGSFIPLHGVEVILEAVKILKLKNITFKLYILGNSEEKCTKYRELVKIGGIEEDVEFNNTYSIKNGSLENFLSSYCDISLGIFGDSQKAKTVIANKEIDSISMKIPLITGISDGLQEYFNGRNDIYMIENTPEALAEKIADLMHMSCDEITSNSGKAYHIYKKYFSIGAFYNNCDMLFSKLEKNVN